MSVSWKCDLCGKETWVNPPSRPIFEENEKKGIRVQKKTKIKVQNIYSGKMEEVEVGAVEDLKPRTYIVKLSVGSSSIQKDFCFDCLQSLKLEIDQLFKKLDSIQSK